MLNFTVMHRFKSISIHYTVKQQHFVEKILQKKIGYKFVLTFKAVFKYSLHMQPAVLFVTSLLFACAPMHPSSLNSKTGRQVP